MQPPLCETALLSEQHYVLFLQRLGPCLLFPLYEDLPCQNYEDRPLIRTTLGVISETFRILRLFLQGGGVEVPGLMGVHRAWVLGRVHVLGPM